MVAGGSGLDADRLDSSEVVVAVPGLTDEVGAADDDVGGERTAATVGA